LIASLVDFDFRFISTVLHKLVSYGLL
jgi:hypothetical protein